MLRATDIINFSEYRKDLRESHNLVNKTGRPLFVIDKGVAEAVVLSPETYEELAERAELSQTLAMISRSEADIKDGRVIDAREGFRKLTAENDLRKL